MAKGSRGGRRSGGGVTVASGGGGNTVVNAQMFSDNDAQSLVDSMDDVYKDPDFVDARKL